MAGTLSLTYLDYSREKAVMTINTVTPSAANLATLNTQITNLVAAINGITLGILHRRQLNIVTPSSAALPTSPEAQREKKWLIGFSDVTANLAAGVTNPMFGKQFTVELPTSFLATHLQTNSDYADLANTNVADFVTAFEAIARSPSGGAVSVNYIKYVGRRL